MTFDAITPGKPEHEWGRDRPKIAGSDLEEKIAKVYWLSLREIRHIDLGAEEECDDRPHSPDQSVTHQSWGKTGFASSMAGSLIFGAARDTGGNAIPSI